MKPPFGPSQPQGGGAPLVVVVVLNWNGFEDTVACLRSLEALDYPNYRVVVVDNGSTDRSAERIRAAYPSVTIVETGRNLGFAGGNNVGIERALERGADFIWLLNNDTTVDPRALSALVAEAAKDPRAGIIGSAVYHAREPGRLQAWGGGVVTWALAGTRSETHEGGPRRLDFVMGTSMLVRREVLEDIGLLDSSYFFYLEDTDFCRRATRRGWRLAVAKESVVHHYIGASIKADTKTKTLEADRLHARSSGIFIGKHAGPRIVVAAPLKLAGMAARRLRRREIDRIGPVTKEFVRGLAFGLRRGRAASEDG